MTGFRLLELLKVKDRSAYSQATEPGIQLPSGDEVLKNRLGTRPPRKSIRLAVALCFALYGGQCGYLGTTRNQQHSDFAQNQIAARELVRGKNPYDAIGPGRAFDWPWPWYYPLPTAVAVAPIVPLSEQRADAVIAFTGVGAFAWALMANGYPSLLAFGSVCLWGAVAFVQWSPLLAAAFVVPALSALLIIKPTIGAAIWFARPNRWAIVGGAVLAAVAFALRPHWPSEWLAALASPNVRSGWRVGHFAAAETPAGFVAILLTLRRWRRPEARLLAALACVPQTMLPYEAVPLFLIPCGWVESVGLVALSHAMTWAVHDVPHSFVPRSLAFARAVPLFLFLPAALMIVRRPNVGPLPAWIERHTALLPGWLRGSPE